MKKYNRLIVLVLVVYAVAAIVIGAGAYKMITEQKKDYKVEINRIYSSLSEGVPLDKLSLRSEEYIKDVQFLSVYEKSEERIRSFYQGENHLELEIKPLFEDKKLVGYIRFDYIEPRPEISYLVMYTEIVLALMTLCCLTLLIYLKYQVVRPFERMNSLPYEMAKGHYKGTVKEEKSRFFGDFIWGLGQLKDTLDVTKNRELQLEKEKKLLFLSLSHDIKTPLSTIKLYGKALEQDLYKDEEKKHKAARQIGVKVSEIEHYVEEIMRNSRENILDIRVEQGVFYLSELVNKVAETYLEKCDIRMTELKIGNFENRLLDGDMERTLEVFDNLFENAFKYGDGRKIDLTFYEEEYCQIIRVFNTGTPVSDTDFNHMFESFFRAGNSEGKSGNGLGLYICREIMSKMGGSIFAEKQEDGMAFCLVFK